MSEDKSISSSRKHGFQLYGGGSILISPPHKSCLAANVVADYAGEALFRGRGLRDELGCTAYP
jgi:hypothetical protein